MVPPMFFGTEMNIFPKEVIKIYVFRILNHKYLKWTTVIETHYNYLITILPKLFHLCSLEQKLIYFLKSY